MTKIRPFVAALMACVLLPLLTGCAGDSPTPSPSPSPVVNPTPVTKPTPQPISAATLAAIQVGATVATGAVLDLAIKDPTQRTTVANQVYATASALYQASGGTMPTPTDFNNLLASYGVTGVSQYTNFTAALSAVYQTYYAKYTSGNITASNLAAVVNALASGAESGASAYASLPAPVAPVATLN